MTAPLKKFAARGEQIYRRRILRSRVSKKKGDFCAIEVKSGNYFLGKTPLEAIEKAELTFPKAKFHLVRVGYPAATHLKKQTRP